MNRISILSTALALFLAPCLAMPVLAESGEGIDPQPFSRATCIANETNNPISFFWSENDGVDWIEQSLARGEVVEIVLQQSVVPVTFISNYQGPTRTSARPVAHERLYRLPMAGWRGESPCLKAGGAPGHVFRLDGEGRLDLFRVW